MDQHIAVIHMIMHRSAILVCLEGMRVDNDIAVRDVSMVKEQCAPHKQDENCQKSISAYFI